MILPLIATAMGLFLMKQSIGQIPDAMIEAAKVDGAGLLKICWGIVMPNSKPALMTIIIFQFQAVWNAETGSLAYNEALIWNAETGSLAYNEALKTIPTVVKQIAAAGIARQGAIASAAVVLMVPPLLIFVLAQRNVMETMAHAGMKD
jgi:ABC-type glycerol-3-phosphate transport system permease component